MALTEQVILDIQQAESQINRLGNQLEELGRPIDIPIEADTTELTRGLQEAEDSARQLTTEMNLTRAASGEASLEVSQLASALGISEDEASALVREIAQGREEANQLQAASREVAQALGLSTDDAAAMEREIRRAAGSMADAESEGRSLAGSVREATDASGSLNAVWLRIRPLIATVAAALGARKVIGEGWERFTTIEDATTALTIQLQSADEAADALAATLEVVRGTPFNLDQFAAATSQLIAFGVEADRIPGILTAIGEAAATRGAEAPQFVDRLVTLFGQITTAGRISANEVNRFADVGVNALAILANSFGVTTEEMRRMISEGLVPAEVAINALTTGIIEGTDGAAGATVALGGTMEGLRDTMTGARGGLNAAVARFGAVLIEAASPAILSWLQSATLGMDNLAAATAKVADSAAAGIITNFIADLPTGFGAATDVVTGLSGAFFSLIDSAALIFSGQAAEGVDAFEAALAALDDTTANIAIRIIEQDVLNALRDGVAPVDAFANALVRLQEKGTLTEQSIRRFLTLTGISESDALTVLNVFRDAEFPDEDLDAFTQAWLNLLGVTGGVPPAFDEIQRGMGGVEAIASELPPSLNDVRVALAELNNVDLDISAEIAQLEQQFSRLPDGLSAAAAALRDEEDAIVEDFSAFLSNLEEELAARQAFADNIAILRSLGLDNLAEVFTDAGLDSSAALADAVANPSEARRAEELLVGFAVDQAAAYAQAFADEISSEPITAELIASIIEAAGEADSPEVQQALGSLAQSLSFQIPVGFDIGIPTVSQQQTGQRGVEVGGPPGGGQITVNQNFEGFTPSSTDLARASQSVNAITLE